MPGHRGLWRLRLPPLWAGPEDLLSVGLRLRALESEVCAGVHSGLPPLGLSPPPVSLYGWRRGGYRKLGAIRGWYHLGSPTEG